MKKERSRQQIHTQPKGLQCQTLPGLQEVTPISTWWTNQIACWHMWHLIIQSLISCHSYALAYTFTWIWQMLMSVSNPKLFNHSAIMNHQAENNELNEIKETTNLLGISIQYWTGIHLTQQFCPCVYHGCLLIMCHLCMSQRWTSSYVKHSEVSCNRCLTILSFSENV